MALSSEALRATEENHPTSVWVLSAIGEALVIDNGRRQPRWVGMAQSSLVTLSSSMPYTRSNGVCSLRSSVSSASSSFDGERSPRRWL